MKTTKSSRGMKVFAEVLLDVAFVVRRGSPDWGYVSIRLRELSDAAGKWAEQEYEAKHGG